MSRKNRTSSPRIIGHRGAPRLARENTLESFRAAVASGADAVELDARRTADGALVVHHDPVLADGRVIVACTAAELPDHVPTLTAALDACTGLIVNVELKNLAGEPDFDPDDAIADEVVALLTARAEPAASWLISSFRRQSVDRCRVVAPGLATAWLTVAPLSDDDVGWAAGAGHRAVHPWVPTVDESTIGRCHDAGLEVNTWTCNDVERARQLSSWGIDGICTDVPDVLVAADIGDAASGPGRPPE